jgi:hypothetical protein
MIIGRERLEENRRLARKCLDIGDIRGAIEQMLDLLLLGEVSYETYEQLLEVILADVGNDIEKARSFVESYSIDYVIKYPGDHFGNYQ